ncbi:MAG: YbbR-like domain-containing protein [Bacteroidetes bacterium]|nr:MAG: YbbR-like domain-containing protein [Bacteroidota bacterium]
MTFRAARFWKAIEFRLNRRSVAFLLCLLLSGLFWLLTSLSKEYVDKVELAVTYEGVPEDLLLANDPATMVVADVKGFGFDLLWNWFNTRSLSLVIDATPSGLSTVNRAGQEWHYFLTNVKNGRGPQMADEQIQLLHVEPDTVFLLFKPKHTKTVPVVLDATFAFRKQYGFGSEPVLQPDSVLIVGPKDMIDSVTFVRTENQTFEDLAESLTADVPLLKFPAGSKVSADRVSVQLEVNVVEYTEGTVTVPVRVIDQEDASLQLFPQEVELRYLVPLPDFDKISASQFDVSATLTDEAIRNSRLEVVIEEHPSNVKQIRAFPPQVEFIIQK